MTSASQVLGLRNQLDLVLSFLQPSKPPVQTSPEFSLTYLHQEWQITESQTQAALCAKT